MHVSNQQRANIQALKNMRSMTVHRKNLISKARQPTVKRPFDQAWEGICGPRYYALLYAALGVI